MTEIHPAAEHIPPRPHFHVGQAVVYRGNTYLIDDIQPVLPGPCWCAWLASPEEYFVAPCHALRRATAAQARELIGITVTT